MCPDHDQTVVEAKLVVMQENTEVVDAGVRVDNLSLFAGDDIRRAGEDIRHGDVVLKAGQRLTPAIVVYWQVSVLLTCWLSGHCGSAC